MTDNRKEGSMRTKRVAALLFCLVPILAACHPVLIPPLNIERGKKPPPTTTTTIRYEMTCIRDPQDPTRCEAIEWIPPGE